MSPVTALIAFVPTNFESPTFANVEPILISKASLPSFWVKPTDAMVMTACHFIFLFQNKILYVPSSDILIGSSAPMNPVDPDDAEALPKKLFLIPTPKFSPLWIGISDSKFDRAATFVLKFWKLSWFPTVASTERKVLPFVDEPIAPARIVTSTFLVSPTLVHVSPLSEPKSNLGSLSFTGR